jgi:hypothetical protein
MLKSFPRRFYLAITDFGFYPQIFRQPLRATLVFLLYLAGLLALLLTVWYSWRLFSTVDDFLAWAGANVPPFEIREGILHTQAAQPLLRTYSGDFELTLVLDTTGAYLEPAGLEEPAILMTRQNLFMRSGGRTQTFTWADYGPFSFDPLHVDGYGLVLKLLYFPTSYSVLLVYHLLAKGLTALLLVPLAYSMALSYGTRFSFLESYAITLHSLAPAVAVDFAVTMSGVEISYFDLIYLAAAAIYTVFAAQRCTVAQ